MIGHVVVYGPAAGGCKTKHKAARGTYMVQRSHLFNSLQYKDINVNLVLPSVVIQIPGPSSEYYCTAKGRPTSRS